jgi:hypothetical protein
MLPSFNTYKPLFEVKGSPWTKRGDIDFGTVYEKRIDSIDVTIDEFEAENDHKPNTMYDVDGELHETDDNGNVFMVDGRLLPNIEYTLNGYTYFTDAYGNIVRVEGNPTLNPENERNNEAQTTVGGNDRRSTDQGGHIISRDLNGDGGQGNLVAMDSRINQSDYKRMENAIKEALEKGKDVSVDIELEYEDDSERPSKIISTVSIDGEKIVFKFDNNMDGGLLRDVPVNGKQEVDDRLEKTGGEISSIKEIYDVDGNLTQTVVTITYKDEQGNNRRIPVPANPD